MKEKIQGLAERKAFILLFLFVWELCSSSGNLTCSPPPPFSPTSREYSLPQPAGALLHPSGGNRSDIIKEFNGWDKNSKTDADSFHTFVSALGYVTSARQKSRRLLSEFLMNTYKLILNR